MTPARLHALVDADDYAHEQAERQAGKGKHRAGRTEVSRNPAADLAALASM